jgi:hypothetical protein
MVTCGSEEGYSWVQQRRYAQVGQGVVRSYQYGR